MTIIKINLQGKKYKVKSTKNRQVSFLLEANGLEEELLGKILSSSLNLKKTPIRKLFISWVSIAYPYSKVLIPRSRIKESKFPDPESR